MPVWVITGVNRGLGLEFVTQLTSDSANTIIGTTRSLSRDSKGLESLKNKAAKFHLLECNTGSQESIVSFGKEVSSLLGSEKIDFLLNNAGINSQPHLTSLTLTAEALSEHMNVNVMGPAKTLQVLESHLQKGTVVMNMTSGLGSLALSLAMDPSKCAAYSISKAAVNMLTVHQADNLKKKGVIVVCMDPGWVKTDMGGKGAVLEPDFAIGGMLKCLKGLKFEDSAKFFTHDGSEKEW